MWRSVLWTAALAVGCASGQQTETDDNGSSSSGTGGTSSGGGTGGTASGTGGSSSGTGGSSSNCDVDCTQIQAPMCQVAQCNEQTGQCEVVAESDGTSCDDGVFCTVDDACVAGICAPGPENDCGISPAACEVISCDEQSQTCASVASQNGDPCVDPNDLCLENATCLNGLCQGTAKDCFMQPVPDDCHISECNPQTGQCEPVVGNEGGPCTDANDLCTVSKTCAAGVCQGGSPKVCSQLTQGCVLGVCDVNSGQCTTQNLNNGDPCDDLDPCTSGELCTNGSCIGGTPVTQCIANDNCCPSGCTVNNDADCAITDLDIGTYGSTYSDSNGTRGYWFTAPTNFTIKELRVPTDVGSDPQNIQVVRFTSGPPPAYSQTTTAFQTLGYWAGVPGTNWIQTNIVVQSGDIIGILGARGTSTMNNSYSATYPYSTTIFGQPLSLARLLYQGNINSAQAGPLSTGSSNYARVEMRYGP
ncbi:MAG: hypothetical protein JRI68_19475 [Deltaproteobacteria bacterium]|nr:hypothetical protein [Deltaproteobacteria bacterium]